MRIILWVDDICVVVPNMCTEQDACGGADKCPECSRCKLRAWELDARFTKDMKALGFETNRKDVAPTTLAFFLNLGFDTVTIQFWFPLDKAQIFATSCKELHTRGEATRREIAAVVGKLMWWNRAIFNVKSLSKGLQHMTRGVDGKTRWDEIVKFSEMTLRELLFWVHNTVKMATRRKPMILPRFEVLEIEWTRLEAGGTHISEGVTFPLRRRLVTDGGPDGWGDTLWLPGVKKPLLGSGKWRPEDIASGKTRQQAWREGWSVILAVTCLPAANARRCHSTLQRLQLCSQGLARRFSQQRYFARTSP